MLEVQLIDHHHCNQHAPQVMKTSVEIDDEGPHGNTFTAPLRNVVVLAAAAVGVNSSSGS